jgi:hypothetical protein
MFANDKRNFRSRALAANLKAFYLNGDNVYNVFYHQINCFEDTLKCIISIESKKLSFILNYFFIEVELLF